MTWRLFIGSGLIGLGALLAGHDALDQYTQIELIVTSCLCLAVGIAYAPTKGDYE